MRLLLCVSLVMEFHLYWLAWWTSFLYYSFQASGFFCISWLDRALCSLDVTMPLFCWWACFGCFGMLELDWLNFLLQWLMWLVIKHHDTNYKQTTAEVVLAIFSSISKAYFLVDRVPLDCNFAPFLCLSQLALEFLPHLPLLNTFL